MFIVVRKFLENVKIYSCYSAPAPAPLKMIWSNSEFDKMCFRYGLTKTDLSQWRRNWLTKIASGVLNAQAFLLIDNTHIHYACMVSTCIIVLLSIWDAMHGAHGATGFGSDIGRRNHAGWVFSRHATGIDHFHYEIFWHRSNHKWVVSLIDNYCIK